MLVTRVSGWQPGPAPFYPARPLSQEAFLCTEDNNQGSEGLGTKLQGFLFLVASLVPLTGAAEYTFTKIADNSGPLERKLVRGQLANLTIFCT
jgi:hypothetical protein